MTQFRLMTSAAVLALASAPVMAQDVYILDTILLSGGLTPVEQSHYGRASSVITGEEIEARGIATVQDALRQIPGVAVYSTGSNFTEVRIRGGEANNTLILIDGIEASGGDGAYVLSGLETDNIARIEVLRGPQSVYYGSNASTGVVNIITKTGDEGFHYGGAIEAGGGLTTSAYVSTRNEAGGIRLNVYHGDDYGWDFSGDGGEKDATTRDTITLTGDYMLTPDLKLGFTLRRSWETYDYDGNSYVATNADEYVVDDDTLYSDRDELTAALYGEYAMMDGQMTHRLTYELTELDQGFGGGAPTETETKALKYLLSYGLDGRSVGESDHLVNLLVEYETDASSSAPDYDRETTSYALEYRGRYFEALDVQAGVRYDDNSVFGDIVTWNAALSYAFDNGVRLHGSAGAGSVNPTYDELFGGWGSIGNLDLAPERNVGFDIGVEVPFLQGRGVIDVTYFDERLEDEITYVGGAGIDGTNYYNQAGTSTRKGVEVGASLAVTDALDLRLGYTYLEAFNPDGSVEVRRPQHELTLGATLDTFGGRGSVSADVRFVTGNYDTQFWGFYETLELPSYTVVNVAADYALTDEITLTGRVENLFDQTTYDAWGYANRPLTAYVGLKASF